MRHLKLTPSWLRFLIIFLLFMSILFRFFNLDGKVFWHDETYTSLRISGYTTIKAKQQIFNGRIISRESFAKFQGVNPSENTLNDTIMSLVIEDSQHPPLYYIIARFWLQIFGNSVTAIRSLSAFISLLVFPAVYWLCQELFDVPLSQPGIAIALMTISPIHLVYAQEAQPYILWLVTILLSSAALLQAMRVESQHQNDLAIKNSPDSFNSWSIYAVTLALSLYTFLWSGLVAVAHGIYVITSARFKLTETVRTYLLASIVGFLAFMPWMAVVIADFFQFLISSDGTAIKLSIIPAIPFLLMQLSRIFIDFNLNLENPLSYLFLPIFLILVAYTIYFLCQTTNYKVWSFVLALIVVPALPLMLPDLFLGRIRSNTEPYLIPSYLGIQLAVAYLLATQLYNGNFSRRRIWQIIMALLIICGLVSYKVNSQAESWWNKGVSYSNPQVAQIINQTNSPLLISDAFGDNFGNIFSLSYLLEPKVRFLLVQDEKIPNIPDGFTDVFLFNPSYSWRTTIEKRYKLKSEIIYSDNYYSVWKLAKSSKSRPMIT